MAEDAIQISICLLLRRLVGAGTTSMALLRLYDVEIGMVLLKMHWNRKSSWLCYRRQWISPHTWLSPIGEKEYP
jgi:hypothetical protein